MLILDRFLKIATEKIRSAFTVFFYNSAMPIIIMQKSSTFVVHLLHFFCYSK